MSVEHMTRGVNAPLSGRSFAGRDRAVQASGSGNSSPEPSMGSGVGDLTENKG